MSGADVQLQRSAQEHTSHLVQVTPPQAPGTAPSSFAEADLAGRGRRATRDPDRLAVGPAPGTPRQADLSGRAVTPSPLTPGPGSP